MLVRFVYACEIAKLCFNFAKGMVDKQCDIAMFINAVRKMSANLENKSMQFLYYHSFPFIRFKVTEKSQ